MRFKYGKKYAEAVKEHGAMSAAHEATLDLFVKLYCAYYGVAIVDGCRSPALWQIWRRVEYNCRADQNLAPFLKGLGGVAEGVVVRHNSGEDYSDWYIEHPARPSDLKDIEKKEQEEENIETKN